MQKTVSFAAVKQSVIGKKRIVINQPNVALLSQRTSQGRRLARARRADQCEIPAVESI